MQSRRFIFLVLLAAPFMIGAEGNCRRITGPGDDEIPDPNNPAKPFLDQFTGGLVNWRLTAPIPNHQLGAGNPLPSLEVGSISTLVTGGVTVRKFDITNGLVIEADVFWEAATGQTTAIPQVWIGLSEDDDPTGNPGVAAGMWVDDAGSIHFQVNAADIGEATAPSAGAWHRFTTTIRADRVVEFRIDGNLQLTGGSVDSGYLIKPVEACGIGYPQRPRIDNVNVRLP
jgi:hypothetical protein